MTYRLQTRYRKPVRISKGTITLRAKLAHLHRNIATIEVILTDGEGLTCSEGQVEYYVLPRDKAEKEMHFPGKEAFYEHQ